MDKKKLIPESVSRRLFHVDWLENEPSNTELNGK
jgi:hypothetical protein